MVEQIVQIVGAVLILAGFAGVQFGRIDPASLLYLVLNAIGSAILAVLGYHERQWGFFLLESVWAIVSIWGIASYFRGRPPASTSH